MPSIVAPPRWSGRQRPRLCSFNVYFDQSQSMTKDDLTGQAHRDSIANMTALLNGIPRVDPTSKPTVMRREVARILATTSGSAFHRKFMAPLDARLMHLTGGRVHFAKGTIRLVLLRTTGARSGVERDVPLSYFTDGDDVILVASNYGQAEHPSWYHNLLKNPECQLFADGRSDSGGSFIARPTDGADHDRLYALIERYASNYSSYATNTNGIRNIPVLRLTPKGR
jgi:deazaflavin-dependent oxidoreductase (nitroreductase family)